MISSLSSLFINLFHSLLQFPDVIMLMAAVALFCLLATFFRYLLKGSY